jgi:hypothetical protein
MTSKVSAGTNITSEENVRAQSTLTLVNGPPNGDALKYAPTVMKTKTQSPTTLIRRSKRGLLVLAIAMSFPIRTSSGEPVEDKAMVMHAAAPEPASQEQMNPYFSAINYNLPKDTLMLMLLPDFQIARTGPNFFTGMTMVEYGVTDRLTVGVMAEGEKIDGLPAAYGGLRFNAYFRVFPDDHFLNFTLYGEYEGLNGAALYKMEVAGFGGEDLEGPLREARRTSVRTFEQRAIVYHDWGRLNATFNFVSETGFDSHENDFGYSWGVFWQPSWMGMEMNGGKTMPGMTGEKGSTPPLLSVQRLGLGVEMIGALGNTQQFGIDWDRQQHYIGPVFSYTLSKNWNIRVEAAAGLSDVSDPFVLRMGVSYSIDQFARRLGRAFR